MMNSLTRCFFLLSFLTFSGFPAFSESVTSGAGDGADAYIELGSDSADTFGSSDELRVRSHPDFPTDTTDVGRFVRKSYLRFDLSSITLTPRAGMAGDVTVQLTWKSAFSGGDDSTHGGLPWTVNLYGLQDRSEGMDGDKTPSEGGWNEDTINGDNAPANDLDNDGRAGATATTGVTEDAVFLATVTVQNAAAADEVLEFSSVGLTDFVRADSNDLVTVILVGGDDSQGDGSIAAFWSDEGTGAAPRLTVTDGVTPTPTPSPEPDPIQALRKVDELFENYFAWFGSMYHRQSGGSYYSFAARTAPEDYPPHIESTSKFNRVIEWSERIPNVPPEMRDQIVAFTKGNQVGNSSSSNYGYFLVNGYNLNDKNKSRALGFSTGILDNYGATPDYPLPGEAGTLPAHLDSADAFITWLEGRNWTRTWTAGGDLLTQGGYIRQLRNEQLRGDILEAVWNYLATEQQDPVTGLWGQMTGNNLQPYIALNGAHKIVAFYKAFDQPVPYAENLMDTARNQVASTVPNNLLYTYNSSQLAHNLTGLGATISETEAAKFVSKQAEYLARFFRPDGGVATRPSGVWSNTYFEPGGVSVTGSNTDRGGLSLKARDRLHDLVLGFHNPLRYADDPRLYGMSGLNSDVLVKYEFTAKSLEAERLAGSELTAGDFSASGTDSSTGDVGDGFYQETDSTGGSDGDFEIGHAGFDDQNSYYTFTVTPGTHPLRLYFLALNMRHGGSHNETVVVTYRVGDAGNFTEAGRTTIRGGSGDPLTRDIPLLTKWDLQDLAEPVTFRIHGWNFDGSGRSFRIDQVELFGVRRNASFTAWIGDQGLTGDDALPETVPPGGSATNLERYAHNLPAPAATHPVLMAGTGTSGLPNLEVSNPSGGTKIRFEFLRRRQSDLVYRPMLSTDLTDPHSWRDVPEPPLSVTVIDEGWERVVYEYTLPGEKDVYGRVEVFLP